MSEVFINSHARAAGNHPRQPAANRWAIQADDALAPFHRAANLIAHAQAGRGHFSDQHIRAAQPLQIAIVDDAIGESLAGGGQRGITEMLREDGAVLLQLIDQLLIDGLITTAAAD